jgi:hypothetical protein
MASFGWQKAEAARWKVRETPKRDIEAERDSESWRERERERERVDGEGERELERARARKRRDKTKGFCQFVMTSYSLWWLSFDRRGVTET